jgi:hypothetical protein
MTMKSALSAVRDRLGALESTLRELAVALDDCDADFAVIEALRTHAMDLEGDLRETIVAATHALQAEQTGDGKRAAHLLADAHERFSGVARRVRFDLSGHDSLFALGRLPQRRGGRWRPWSEVVLRQLEQVDDDVHRADLAFVRSWQEVVDRGEPLVAVLNTQPRKETVHV